MVYGSNVVVQLVLKVHGPSLPADSQTRKGALGIQHSRNGRLGQRPPASLSSCVVYHSYCYLIL